jgi:predicted esterase YcpF (UPF0227 family)
MRCSTPVTFLFTPITPVTLVTFRHSFQLLIYIHGFNSSALSFKATLLRKRMAEMRRARELVCPEFPHRPREAIALLEDLVAAHRGERIGLIGSSLGGYYATWLAERHALKAVLVNPAVRPYALLEEALGRQTNLYTGAAYELTREHLAELRALETKSVTPERYLLMVATGDEVLDYREAVAKYRGCTQLVIDGGDHGFGDFPRYMDRALEFARG